MNKEDRYVADRPKWHHYLIEAAISLPVIYAGLSPTRGSSQFLDHSESA